MLDAELGQVPMGEQPRIALRGGCARETREERQEGVWLDLIAEALIDLTTEALHVVRLSASHDKVIRCEVELG
jgi:hypothetical protein